MEQPVTDGHDAARMTAQLFMLDTDTCIFLMRGESQTLAAKVQSVPLQQQVMSAVTFAELIVIPPCPELTLSWRIG
jgi:hypothetical protein